MNNDIFPGWDSVTGKRISDSELDHAFSIVKKKAGSPGLQDKNKYKRIIWSLAAACLALLSFGFGISVYSSSHRQTIVIADSIEYSTGKGEIKEVVLPDDSKVVLNSSSLLICPTVFGETRSVYLLGEAVFDVTASDENPFVVRTSDIKLRVHGTRFNVKAYYDDPDVRTTLYRGAVEVWPADNSDRRIELKPGETLTYNKEGRSMVVTKGFVAEATSWESGDLFFRSESIQGVIRILERHFNVNIYLTTDKYDDAVITASFIHGEELEDLLKALSAVIPGMKYNIDKDIVYLK